MRVKSKPRDTLIVLGLGNPGREYEKTRHNAGFLVLEELAERFSLKFKKPFFRSWRSACTDITTGEGFCRLVLAAPLTYMNASGKVVPDILQRYTAAPKQIIVVCDSLDLPSGIIRIKQRGSSAGQKGLESIISVLGTDKFKRLFVGIGRPDQKKEVISWVLSAPLGEELSEFRQGISRAADAVLEMTRLPLERVMNKYNGTAKE